MANGEHVEIAKCYITVIPSLEGSQGTITKELTGATIEAGDKAGKESGAKFGESFSKNIKKAGVAIGAALAGAGAAAVATGKAFVDSAKNVAAYGDNIDKMSQKMGISAKSYQEWDFILQHAGASIDSLKMSMKTLATAAVNGSDAFTALGISQEQLASMSQEEIFNATISALQNVEDETQRTALASKLLGRGATELGALFNMSAEETEALRQQVHDLGGVMSDEAVKDAATFQDEMQNMNTAMDGMKRNMMSNFLPGITTVMSGMAKVFSGNGGVEEIQSGLQSVITKITTLAPQFLPVAQTIITSLITGFGPMIPQLTEAIFTVIITAITTITSMIPSMMPAIISGIQGIIQATISALPVIISGLTQLIMALVQWLSSDGVIQSLVDGIVQMTAQMVNSFAMILPILLPAIVKIIMEVCKALTEPSNVKLLLDAVLTLVGAIFVTLVNCVPELIEGVKGVLLNLGNLFGDFLSWIVPIVAAGIGKVVETVKTWGNNIKNFISGLINGIRQGISDWITNLKNSFVTGFNFIKDKISSILGNIGDFIKSVIEKLKELPTKAVNIGKDLIQGLINGIKNMATKAVNTVKDVGKNLVNGIKGVLKIGSPSKVFEQIGAWTAEGFGIGYEDTMNDFKSDMAIGMNGITTSMVADISAHAPDNYGTAGDTYNGGAVTINVYGAEGQNINDLAQEIAYRLDSMTKRKEAIYA